MGQRSAPSVHAPRARHWSRQNRTQDAEAAGSTTDRCRSSPQHRSHILAAGGSSPRVPLPVIPRASSSPQQREDTVTVLSLARARARAHPPTPCALSTVVVLVRVCSHSRCAVRPATDYVQITGTQYIHYRYHQTIVARSHTSRTACDVSGDTLSAPALSARSANTRT